MNRRRMPKCPYCKSSATSPKGYRNTVTMGKRPIRRCNACGRRFTVNKTQNKRRK